MDDFFRGEKHAAFLHILQNDGVGFVRPEAGIFAGVFRMAALVIHRDDHLNAVPHTGLVVVCAKAGGRVDTARAGIHGDIVRQQKTGGLRQEGVGSQHVLKEGAGVAFQNLKAVKPTDPHDTGDKRFGHNIDFPVRSLDESILLIRMESNGEVTGKRPDRGGPDQEKEFGSINMTELSQIILHREFDIDCRTGVIVVFDFGFRESSLVLGAPVDGLEALIDMTVAVHLSEDADFICLKTLVHGFVGMIPVPDHAEALKALPLNADILFGIGFAGRAEFCRAHGLVVELLLLDDGGFNRHAVIVPSGDIRRPVPAHGIGADDKIFQGFVQSMPHVDGAVGEGRAVVQGIAGVAFIFFQQFMIDIKLVPPFEHVRLPLRETGTHGEIGFRKVEGCVVIL